MKVKVMTDTGSGGGEAEEHLQYNGQLKSSCLHSDEAGICGVWFLLCRILCQSDRAKLYNVVLL